MQTVLIEYSHPQLNSIEIDDAIGGQLAARHIIGKGHRQVAFLGEIESPEKYAIHPVKSRLQGFKNTLDEAGIPLLKKYIKSAPYMQENSQRAAHELLSMDQPPTAIFAAADIQAISIMKVARQLKLRIPDDLAVVRFDEFEFAEYMELTTIRQYLDQSGRLAAEILLSHLADSDRALQHIKIPLTLIERQTA